VLCWGADASYVCAVCVHVLQGFINVLNWYLLPPGEQLNS
jgi:hypothetical protein